VFRKEHQTFEIVIIEALARDAVTKEKPADDTPVRVQRDDDFGPKGVERTPHQSALRLIECLSEVAPVNDMRVQFEPANQRIALAIFDLSSFGKATQPGAKPIMITLPDFGKNAYTADASGIGHAFDNAGEQSLNVIKTAKDPRKPEQWHRRLAPFRNRFDAPRLWDRRDGKLLAQVAVFLQDTQVLEST
jgi:hypothetical protein